MLKGDSERLQNTWESWATNDPLFAILSDPTKRGGRWDLEEFMAHTPELDQALAIALRHQSLLGHSSTLDFGCGVGRITQALAKHFERIVGVDISETMIAQARKLNRYGDRCQYVSGDLKQFDDAAFDFVFTVYVIQHIPRSMQGQVLRELVRVVKPDGVVACQIAAPARGIARLRTQFGPRWFKEMRFSRRYGRAPLIEMNPLREEEVRKIIAPARITAVEGEWFLMQPSPNQAHATR